MQSKNFTLHLHTVSISSTIPRNVLEKFKYQKLRLVHNFHTPIGTQVAAKISNLLLFVLVVAIQDVRKIVVKRNSYLIFHHKDIYIYIFDAIGASEYKILPARVFPWWSPIILHHRISEITAHKFKKSGRANNLWNLSFMRAFYLGILIENLEEKVDDGWKWNWTAEAKNGELTRTRNEASSSFWSLRSGKLHKFLFSVDLSNSIHSTTFLKHCSNFCSRIIHSSGINFRSPTIITWFCSAMSSDIIYEIIASILRMQFVSSPRL